MNNNEVISQEKKELVVYKNEFNKISLKNFTASEMDLLFSIMSQMRNKNVDEVEFDFGRLKELSKYNKENAISSFVKDLEATYDKLIQINVKLGDSKEFTKFVFFTKYSISTENQTVKIRVNDEFSSLINQLTGNFTKLELDEITSLKSTYSKTIYRLLKQYRSTGYATFYIDEFREIADIPESYLMGNITQRVIKPAIKELRNLKYFKNLNYNTIKGKGKNKRKVERIEFRFWNDDGAHKGNRVFRKEDGSYYEKYIEDWDENEIKKAIPEVAD